jgi:hypothetical protein
MIWSAPAIWEDGECFIIGGGFSMPRQFGVPEEVIQAVCERRMPETAYSEYLKPLHDKHVIGVNNAYKIGNWIDVCFFGDCGWWLLHQAMLRTFPGLLVSCCPRFEGRDRSKMEGVKFLAKDPDHQQGISNDPKKVSWNWNSGAAAISLAAHFGVTKIYLLGFDMKMENDRFSHWHGSHRPPTEKSKRPPPFKRHLTGFSAIETDANARGISIYNLNPESAIEAFKKVSLEEIL